MAQALAEAWVTMVTSSDYVPGAVTLAHSLRQHAAPHRPLVCMITDDLDEDDRRALRAVGMELELVKPIAAPVTFPVSG
jgi:CheY-like chemotaxis protein